MAAKPKRWRGGRVVECTGLENQHTFTGIGGSNPPPSANQLFDKQYQRMWIQWS